MKKLTTLILSAAFVPALALSTAVIADKHGDMKADGEQHADEQRAGEQQLSGKPEGAFFADDIIGKTIKHRGSDEDVGEIEDLIIGQDGRIIGVVVQTGGFLGLGGQDVGLGWGHIEHTLEDGDSVFYTDIDEETLRNSPEYERD